MEFKKAPAAPPVPVISKVTSPEARGTVGLPVGIISGHASSLHSNGAVKTFELLKVQVISSENVAVKSIASPSAGNTTSTKVCGEVKPTTDTDAVPSPERSKVPVAGAPEKVTVISAVNVSSVISLGVPLSLHTSTLDELISVILHGGNGLTVTVNVA